MKSSRWSCPSLSPSTGGRTCFTTNRRCCCASACCSNPASSSSRSPTRCRQPTIQPFTGVLLARPFLIPGLTFHRSSPSRSVSRSVFMLSFGISFDAQPMNRPISAISFFLEHPLLDQPCHPVECDFLCAARLPGAFHHRPALPCAGGHLGDPLGWSGRNHHLGAVLPDL